MELQRNARQRAREARLANLPPGPTSDDDNSELSQRLGQWQDDLMELVEQGKAAIGRVVVPLIPIVISASRFDADNTLGRSSHPLPGRHL